MDAVLSKIREGAVRYGIPPATLYDWAASGVPGFVRHGRSVRIHREIFERWLAQQAQGESREDAA